MCCAIIIGVLGGIDLSAYADTSDDYEYIVLEDGTAKLTWYSGADGDVIIPSIINGYTVTGIGNYLFSSRAKITNIVIPNSVINIGNNAFQYCYSLTNIFIPASVINLGDNVFYSCLGLTEIIVDEANTNYSSQDGVLFNKDKDVLLQFPSDKNLETYSVPNSVTSIYNYAFNYCVYLKNVEIPETVTSIGKYAFCYCDNLNSINIPNSVTNIGLYAFTKCISLTSIVIPDNVQSIEEGVFEYCTSLENVNISKNIITIGDLAFRGCINLKSITLPESVISISNSAFIGCSGLISIVVDENNAIYDSRNNCNALIEKSTDTLIVGCKNTVIPDTVLSIGRSAFKNCTGLSSILIPNSVTNISDNAFCNCTSLKNVTITYGVTYIGFQAFDCCENLTDVYYTGSEEQWNNIVIGYENDSLQNATIHFNYTPECSHVYEVISAVPATADTNEVITYQCSLCGKQYVEESSLNLADFKLKTVSLSLASSITMNFKVLKTAVADFENPYVQFTRNGNTVTVSEYTEQGDYLVFAYKDIAPQAMNDTVIAVLKATHNTIEYSSSPLEYSVSKYVYTMLDKCSGDQYAKLRTLLVDLLNYGAEAQSYQNYKTDDLVNSKLTDAQKAWASTDELALADVTDKNYSTIENALVEWKSASLQLNNSVAVRYKFTAQSVENLSVKVECGASQWEYGADSFTDNGDGTYYFLFNDLNADKMSKDIFITVMHGDTAVSNTMRFSVESYSKKVQDLMPNSSLQKLTDAMMRYGRAAANYA